jgi:hypothetical protein
MTVWGGCWRGCSTRIGLASLLTRLVLDAVEGFDIDLSRLHNDSTSLKLSGAYEQADGRERGGKPTPAARYGFSKDHRPDLKQLVWILTVTADGAVPSPSGSQTATPQTSPPTSTPGMVGRVNR